MANIQKRVYKNGTVRYQVLVRLRGHPPQSATFERRTDARHWAAETESAIRHRRHFPAAAATRHTLAEAVVRYRAEVLPRKRPATARDQARQLGWWVRELGAYRLAALTPAHLAVAQQRLASTPSPRTGRPRSASTVRAYLMALSHLFSVAVREWEWAERNPVQRLTKPRPARGRTRFLSPAEWGRLRAACRAYPALELAVLLALSTGARRTEIWGLRWGQVDLARALLVLPQTKNGETRGLPLVGEALARLRAHAAARRPAPPAAAAFVFAGRTPDKPLDLRAQWEAAVRAAGLVDFRYHDLRHTAASYLAMSGATLAEIAEILGHKTLQMVKRYAHFTVGHTAQVLARMAHTMLSPDGTAGGRSTDT